MAANFNYDKPLSDFIPTTASAPAAHALSKKPAVRISIAAVVASRSARTPEPVPESMRNELIKQAAYSRAEQRGFLPGFELDDWLAAESEVDSLLRERYR